MSSARDQQRAIQRQRGAARLAKTESLRQRVQFNRPTTLEQRPKPMAPTTRLPEPEEDTASGFTFGIPFSIPSLSRSPDSFARACSSPSFSATSCPLGYSYCFCAGRTTPDDTAVIFPPKGPVLNFTLFTKLPLEIRNMIWEDVCFLDRVIDLRCSPSGPSEQRAILSHRYTCLATQPAVLHTSHEARSVGLQHYSLEFGSVKVEFGNGRYKVILQPARLYINFASDIICPVCRSVDDVDRRYDVEMQRNIEASTKIRRLGLQSSEIDEPRWHSVLKKNTSITELIFFSETTSSMVAFAEEPDKEFKINLYLDHLQEYIDRSWADEGFDENEEEHLLEWKYNIPRDLRRKHEKLAILAAKKGLAPPLPLKPIPKIFFAIMKAEDATYPGDAMDETTNVEATDVEAATVEGTEL